MYTQKYGFIYCLTGTRYRGSHTANYARKMLGEIKSDLISETFKYTFTVLQRKILPTVERNAL